MPQPAPPTPTTDFSPPRDHQGRFHELVGDYADDLFRYACWLTQDRPTAEDLVQETLLRAWRALDRLQEEKAAKAWLFTILRRENARRFERIRPELADVEVGELRSHQPGYDTSTEAFVLRHALQRLPNQYREPLLLQILGGYSYAEIARHLKITRAAVTSRLFRARQRMQAQLMENPS